MVGKTSHAHARPTGVARLSRGTFRLRRRGLSRGQKPYSCPTSSTRPTRSPTTARRRFTGPAAVRGGGGGDDDRGARHLQRQGQAGARLGAALPLVAQGLLGSAGVTRAGDFDGLQPPPSAIAHRALGSASGAEDPVQGTRPRHDASSTQPTSTKAFLSAVVARISIDLLRSTRFRREKHVGRRPPSLCSPSLLGVLRRSARFRLGRRGRKAVGA
jgi:hypothetical protein